MTLRVAEEVEVATRDVDDEPEEEPPLPQVVDRPVPSGERSLALGWLGALWLGFLFVAFTQASGLIEEDTKLPLVATPVTYFGEMLHLWNQAVFGGTTELGTGFLFPMGLFFMVTHLLHIPTWAAERIWLASLLTLACWGVVRLSEALGIGSRWTRVVAGLAYCAAPIVITWITTSGALLAVVFLPWMLRPLVNGAREGSTRRAAARSGVAVALMGGSNAVVVLAALPVGVIWLLTRTRGPRRRSLSLWWLGALAMACFWWLVSTVFVAKYGYNYLPYTETAYLTQSTTSVFEALRGASYWIDYFNLNGPLLPGAWILVSESLVVVASAIVAGLGLAGLTRRIPERMFLVCTLAFGVLTIAAGYAGTSGGPFAAQVQHMLQGRLAPFRNVGKFAPDVALPLVLGLAYVLAAPSWGSVGRRVRSWRPTLRSLRLAIIALAVASLVLAAAPFWRDALYRGGGFAKVPTYWNEAGAFLNAHQGHENALLVPSASFAYYTWGNPVDEPLQDVAHTSLEWRNIIPVGSNGYNQMLDAVEQALDTGTAPQAFAQYLAREGINYVVERNDLNLKATGAPPPAEVHQVLSEASGLTEVASFGHYLPSRQVQFGTLPVYDTAATTNLRPVEIFKVEGASSAVQSYPAADPVVLSGGVSSLVPLEAAGVVSGRAAVLSGDTDSVGVTRETGATWADTDGNQRRITSFGSVRYNQSYLLGPNQVLPGFKYGVPDAFAVVTGAGHQTVSDPIGAASVSASSFGSTPLIDQPNEGPAASFENLRGAAWVADAARNSVGQWISIAFIRPVDISTIMLRPLAGTQYPTIERVAIATDHGTVIRSLSPRRAVDSLNVAPGMTRFLKVTILRARAAAHPPKGGIVLGAGIAHISIPGMSFQPQMRLPADQLGAFSAPGAGSTVVSLSRPQTNANLTLGLVVTDDPTMARTFSLPRSESVSATGTAIPVPSAQLSDLLEFLHPMPSGALRATASSSLGDLPRFGPENLVDGSGSPWIAAVNDLTPSITLSWDGPRPVSSVSLHFTTTAARPKAVTITPPGGPTSFAPVPASGLVTFPAVTTTSLKIAFVRESERATLSPNFGVQLSVPVGLSAVGVPGLLTTPVTTPNDDQPVTLACGQGPTVDIDGVAVQTEVTGTLGNLYDLQPMRIKACPTGGTTLHAGEHSFAQTPTSVPFTVTGFTLAPGVSPPRSGHRAVVALGAWNADTKTIQLGAGPASDIVVAQNFDRGWVATFHGKTLTPFRADGWEQGYRVPAGAAGVVTMTMAPDRQYRALLLLGVLLLVGLAALALVPVLRRKKQLPESRPRPLPAPALLLGASLIVVFVVAGPWALVVLPLVGLGRWAGQRWLAVLALAAFATAGVAAAIHPAILHSAGADAFGATAQVASVVSFTAVLAALVVEAMSRRTPAAQPH